MKSSVLVFLICISTALSYVEIAMKCPDGWTWFARSRGGWCMKVFAGAFTNPGAEAKCNEEGAVIAGVQDSKEVKFMIEGLRAVGQTGGSLWVGAKRPMACWSVVGVNKVCTAKTSFYWTDDSTTGFSGFKWLAGEPNNMGGQDCIQLFEGTGLMDDLKYFQKGYEGISNILIYRCTAQTKGYVCGKTAQF